MKPFRIVIIKATLPTYWYADLIGEEFEVFDIEREFPRPSSFLVNYKGDTHTYGVSWCDCELVKEE